MDILLELLKIGSVGIISGLFASILTIIGHRNKKIWEIRVTAYQDVIEALSDLKYYFNQHFKAATKQSEMSSKEEIDLKSLWENAYNKVRKFTDTGAFLFSEKAEQALRIFIKNMNQNHDSLFDYSDFGIAATRTCIKKLVKYSKEDLKLKFSFSE